MWPSPAGREASSGSGAPPYECQARGRGRLWKEFGGVTPIYAPIGERKRPANGRCRGRSGETGRCEPTKRWLPLRILVAVMSICTLMGEPERLADGRYRRRSGKSPRREPPKEPFTLPFVLLRIGAGMSDCLTCSQLARTIVISTVASFDQRPSLSLTR